MNYVAAAHSIQFKSVKMLAAGVAADNLLIAAYLLFSFAIPSIGFIRKIFKINTIRIKNYKTQIENQTKTERLH